MNIRLRQLRAYQATMSFGTVSAAADSLHLTQSSVSRLLAGLEHELGFSLFYRRGRRLVPSVEGRNFFQRIEGALASIEGITTIANDVRLNQGERLRVCAIAPLINSQYLPKALSLFSDEFPKLKFTIEMQVRMDIEEWVASRQADLGFTLLPAESGSVDFEPIVTAAAVAIVPPDHAYRNKSKITPKDLQEQRVILPKQTVRLRRMLDATLLNYGLDFALFSESSDSQTSCHMVAHGLGIGICQPFSCTGLPAGSLKVLRWSPEIKLTYAAIWPKDRKPSKNALRLIEIMQLVGQNIINELPAAQVSASNKRSS
ncbi:MAG: LysR family transcriptional regulator [Rhizobiaceae bacterium]